FKSQNSRCELHLCGDWQLGDVPAGEALCEAVPADCKAIALVTEQLGRWDSSLAIALLQLARWADAHQVTLDTSQEPQRMQQLLHIATYIHAYAAYDAAISGGFALALHNVLIKEWQSLRETLIFTGDICLALGRWVRGKAQTCSI